MYRTNCLSPSSLSHRQTQRHSVIKTAASVCVPSCGEVNGEGESEVSRQVVADCLIVSVCVCAKLREDAEDGGV